MSVPHHENLEQYAELWGMQISELKQILKQNPVYIDDRINFERGYSERLAARREAEQKTVSELLDDEGSSFATLASLDMKNLSCERLVSSIRQCAGHEYGYDIANALMYYLQVSDAPRERKLDVFRSVIQTDNSIKHREQAALKLVSEFGTEGYIWIKEHLKVAPDALEKRALKDLRKLA